MKTGTLLLAAFLLCGTSFFAQIVPNGNFESWGEFGQFFESPEFWQTSNNETDQAVFKDTDAVEGMYSMHIVSVNFGAGLYGEASIGIPYVGDSISLSAFVKGEIEGAAQINVYCEKYLNGEFISNYGWYSNTTVSDWIEISIITDSAPTDSIVIRAVAVGGDFAFGEAEMWIDAVSIPDLNTGIPEIKPTTPDFVYDRNMDMIRFQSAIGEIDQIHIYDLNGRLILMENADNQISTTTLITGVYLLVYTGKFGRKSAQILVE